MPWVEEATKDVVWLRKASGSRLTGFDPEMSEWGNLIETNLNVFRLKVGMSEPGEVKHFSTQRKRKQDNTFHYRNS